MRVIVILKQEIKGFVSVGQDLGRVVIVIYMKTTKAACWLMIAMYPWNVPPFRIKMGPILQHNVLMLQYVIRTSPKLNLTISIIQ